MFDKETQAFKRSLAETIAWCTRQPLTNRPEESSDIQRRRALLEEANRLFRVVYDRFYPNWDKMNASAEYRQAKELHSEADPLNLSLLDDQLRSTALKPSFPLDRFADELWAKGVAEVVAKRSAAQAGVSMKVDPQILGGGRLLEFNPSETLMDGAAKYSSNGFFDVNNVPPWDIWVAFSERTLVSWVPPVLVEIAQKGIDANPECCIRWAE
jgi:hypothetical protein